MMSGDGDDDGIEGGGRNVGGSNSSDDGGSKLKVLDFVEWRGVAGQIMKIYEKKVHH